jgi:squalene cyclase
MRAVNIPEKDANSYCLSKEPMVAGLRATEYVSFLMFHFNTNDDKSCETMTYVEHPTGSQVVMTAWAVIGLLEARYPDRAPIEKGLKLIMSRQQPNGEWLQEAIEGVFNKSCMISYPNYKFIFPIKALGMFAKTYGDVALL